MEKHVDSVLERVEGHIEVAMHHLETGAREEVAAALKRIRGAITGLRARGRDEGTRSETQTPKDTPKPAGA